MRGAGGPAPAAMALPASEVPGPDPASGAQGPNGKGMASAVDLPDPNVSVRNDQLRRAAVSRAVARTPAALSQVAPTLAAPTFAAWTLAVLRVAAPKGGVPKDGPPRRAPPPPALTDSGPRKGGPWIAVLVVTGPGAASPLGPGRRVADPAPDPVAVGSSAGARLPGVPSARRTADPSAPAHGVRSASQLPARP